MTERYGAAHRRLRAAWAPIVKRGEAVCVRVYDPALHDWVGCNKPIRPSQRWDLGHVPGGGPDDYVGPQHVRCNRGGGARKANAQRRRIALTTSEDW